MHQKMGTRILCAHFICGCKGIYFCLGFPHFGRKLVAIWIRPRLPKLTSFVIRSSKLSVRIGVSRIFRLCFRLINSSMLGILDVWNGFYTFCTLYCVKCTTPSLSGSSDVTLLFTGLSCIMWCRDVKIGTSFVGPGLQLEKSTLYFLREVLLFPSTSPLS
jgi:hypothetical protein